MNDLFQVLDHTADGAFIIDENQHIIYWNQAAQQILGYTSEEVMGQPCYALLQGCDDQGQVTCCHYCRVTAAALAGETVTNYDVAVRTKSGEIRWLNISILASPAANDPTGPLIVHLFRDATQTKLNEQFLRQMFETVARWQKTTEPATPSNSTQSAFEKLTDREREVLALLAQGLSTEEIAQLLSISAFTVRNHIQNTLHKLHFHSRLEAVAYAFEHGLVSKE
jgi:PAS domain S-box-containing protein